MKVCPSEESLAGFDASGLSAEHTERVGRHIAGCRRCRQRLEQQHGAAAWLDDMLKLARGDRIEPCDVAPDCTPRDERKQIQSLIVRGLLEATSSPPFGAKLGVFTVTGYLGAGGMGIVLKADDTALNRTVALKLMRPELTHDAAAVARFEREARCCGSLRHPNIVTVHTVDSIGDTRYLVMEYVDGTSLAKIVRSGERMSTARIRSFLEQMTTALACAHGAGVIHRDLKSSNILVEHATDRVKLVDFGLARLMSSETRLTRSNVTVGTPEYMSPEQVRGDTPIDARADLYSIGVVLYEMLTGYTPFRGTRASSVLYRILNEPPRDPVAISRHADRHLSAIALRLMAKRPADRLPSAEAVLSMLRAHRPVRHPERERILWRRGMVASTSVVLVGIIWFLATVSPFATPTDEEITSLHVAEFGSGRETAIWVRRGDRPELRRFHDFGAAAKFVQDAVLVDIGDKGEALVVAGTARAVDGACVFAFDQRGRQRWRCDASWEWQWPDCEAPTPFRCFDLATGPLKAAGKHMIVAAVGDTREYASRVVIIDPETGQMGASFWHMGNVSEVMLIEDYFADGQSAIIVTGYANKLDGFNKPRKDDPAPRTRYDIVPVAMILDPQTMDGVGPPHTNRVPLKPVMPVQYAFLDVPHESFVGAEQVDAILESGPGNDVPLPFGIDRLTLTPRSDRQGICEVEVQLHKGNESKINHGFLTFDRSLKLVNMLPVTGQTFANTIEYWIPLWKHVVLDGQFVEVTAQPTLQSGP